MIDKNILEPISFGKFSIRPLDGTRTIVKGATAFAQPTVLMGSVATDGLGTDFDELDLPGLPTPETIVQPYKILQRTIIPQNAFAAFNLPLNELCITQDQIVEYVDKNPDCIPRCELGRLVCLFHCKGEYRMAFIRKQYFGNLIDPEILNSEAHWWNEHLLWHRILAPVIK